MSILDQAITVAKQNLRLCYGQHGILAGRHHFTDYWARDGFFAAFGALAIGDQKIVEKMVELFFKFQRPDGLIPYRIRNSPVTLGRYFGFHPQPFPHPKPSYRLRENGREVLDGTTLTLLFLAELGLRNWKNSRQFIPAVQKAASYLLSREKYGLLWDGVMAEWMDSIHKSGNLLYTNIIYWRTLSRLADWLTLINPEKSKAGFTLETNTPAYPWRRIWWLSRLAGMADYQNHGLLWWQPGLAYILALQKIGKLKQAKEFLENMAKKVIADGGLYECYERNGRPVKRLFYQSEHPFAWAAGIFLWVARLSKIS